MATAHVRHIVLNTSICGIAIKTLSDNCNFLLVHNLSNVKFEINIMSSLQD